MRVFFFFVSDRLDSQEEIINRCPLQNESLDTTSDKLQDFPLRFIRVELAYTCLLARKLSQPFFASKREFLLYRQLLYSVIDNRQRRKDYR